MRGGYLEDTARVVLGLESKHSLGLNMEARSCKLIWEATWVRKAM